MRPEWEWVCEHCGEQGRAQDPIDTVQCPRCGAPVVPTGPR